MEFHQPYTHIIVDIISIVNPLSCYFFNFVKSQQKGG
nr:MAG TPA: hypothetical protein [Caudoviricetes sp.]